MMEQDPSSGDIKEMILRGFAGPSSDPAAVSKPELSGCPMY